VRACVERRGARLYVADSFTQNNDVKVCVHFEGRESSIKIAGDGWCLGGDAVTGVWWRLKPPFDQYAIPESEREGKLFADREWRHTIEAFEFLLPNVTWMNPRAAERKIQHKPTQLLLASRFGFKIPPTVITNDATEAIQFIADVNHCAIYKPLTFFFEPPNKLLFTNQITATEIADSKDNLRVAPGIFQQRIDKRHELRVTVVGRDVHCIRIDSQATAQTALDWRTDQLGLTYHVEDLPQAIEEKLLAFHQTLGLVYGAYDFIVTPDEQYVFLEVNPVGQWLWLEEIAGVPISESIASCLLQPANKG
jgi:glutathione synthase/RimK-type ligase-like ATP-grasp enzyme